MTNRKRDESHDFDRDDEPRHQRDQRGERDERDSFGARRGQSDDGGAPFARGQELGREDEGSDRGRFGGSPGSYGRQSHSPTSSTYSGRSADPYGVARGRDERSPRESGELREPRDNYGSRQGGYRESGSGQGSYGQGGRGRGSETGSSDVSWRSGGTQRTGNHGKGPKGYQRSDDRIKEDVCDRLMQDLDIDASEIEVAVSQGEVTLSGTTESRDVKWQVECLVDDVPGVKDVQNNLRVQRQHGESGSQGNQGSQSSQFGATGSASRTGTGPTTGGSTGTSGGKSRASGGPGMTSAGG